LARFQGEAVDLFPVKKEWVPTVGGAFYNDLLGTDLEREVLSGEMRSPGTGMPEPSSV